MLHSYVMVNIILELQLGHVYLLKNNYSYMCLRSLQVWSDELGTYFRPITPIASGCLVSDSDDLQIGM